jgi:hypothetical protein
MLLEKLHKTISDMHAAEATDNATRKEFGDAYHAHAIAMQCSFACVDVDSLNKAVAIEEDALVEFCTVSSRLHMTNSALEVSRDRFLWLISCADDDSRKSDFGGFLSAFELYEACPCEAHLNLVVGFSISGWRFISDMDTYLEVRRAARVVVSML